MGFVLFGDTPATPFSNTLLSEALCIPSDSSSGTIPFQEGVQASGVTFFAPLSTAELLDERTGLNFAEADPDKLLLTSSLTACHPLTAGSVVSFIDHLSSTPHWIIGVPHSLLQELAQQDRPLLEAVLCSLLLGVARGLEIEELSLDLPVEGPSLFSQKLQARLLQFTVDRWNIEDLFPHLPFEAASTEAASLAYHRLAARFLRYASPLAAGECVKCSDILEEENPRSSALRAALSMERGQSLGAVAHLISSLQQYEVKSSATALNPLPFKNPNPEKVQNLLEEGLAALNKIDNQKAIHSFAAAVVEFDNFFEEEGIKNKLYGQTN